MAYVWRATYDGPDGAYREISTVAEKEDEALAIFEKRLAKQFADMDKYELRGVEKLAEA